MEREANEMEGEIRIRQERVEEKAGRERSIQGKRVK